MRGREEISNQPQTLNEQQQPFPIISTHGNVHTLFPFGLLELYGVTSTVVSMIVETISLKVT